jgi:hypothetical protein
MPIGKGGVRIKMSRFGDFSKRVHVELEPCMSLFPQELKAPRNTISVVAGDMDQLLTAEFDDVLKLVG